MSSEFRTDLGQKIFKARYAMTPDETWAQRARHIVDSVCGTAGGTETSLLPKDEIDLLVEYISKFYFMPGGRYIYYGGRPAKFYNNCMLFKGEEDTREEWGSLLHRNSDALMSGAGVGNDFSVFREEGAPLGRTGGTASGPIPLAMSINDHGRHVRQGGTRRSAIYGNLLWTHGDIDRWLTVKDWANTPLPGVPGMTYADAKNAYFDFEAPLDMTNISASYDNAWLRAVLRVDKGANLYQEMADWEWQSQHNPLPAVFMKNVEMALRNGEPGFAFNFFDKENETLRNACTEVTSEDDSDICNLGSLNLAAIPDRNTLRDVVHLATKFLLCGTLRADMPTAKARLVREKNRRLGLGLMGVHEWLLQRGYRYEVTPELHRWLQIYKTVSDEASRLFADHLGVSRPVANRAVAPTGTIGMVAGTTTGIEPIFAVAYKRRWIADNTRKYQYAIDQGAENIIQSTGADPESIETALDLAKDPERRIAFQADIQDYVDQAISSTINLPAWGSEHNNEDKIESFARTLARYAPRLRGFTAYPDGARGGQPLQRVSYVEAKSHGDAVFEENSENACKSGVCGI